MRKYKHFVILHTNICINMFDESFDYHLIQKRKSNEFGVLNENIYSFNSTKRRYIVLVEEYDNLVFVPKFYPSTYRNSPNKYILF